MGGGPMPGLDGGAGEARRLPSDMFALPSPSSPGGARPCGLLERFRIPGGDCGTWATRARASEFAGAAAPASDGVWGRLAGAATGAVDPGGGDAPDAVAPSGKPGGRWAGAAAAAEAVPADVLWFGVGPEGEAVVAGGRAAAFGLAAIASTGTTGLRRRVVSISTRGTRPTRKWLTARRYLLCSA